MPIIRPTALADLAAIPADITLIGAGPLGIAMAIALADRGKRVLVLESGDEAPRPDRQDLACDHVLTPDTHHDAAITTARRLGGAANLWGGRCVPCDPIDFEERSWLGLGRWPVSKADLDPYQEAACALLGAGKPVFASPVAGVTPKSDSFALDRLERWSDQPRTQILHKTRLAQDPQITIALGVTVTGFALDAARISALDLHLHQGAQTGQLPVRQVILAAGGNASTRLLLNVQAARPALFGGADGPLGRFYMGHVNGQIADIIFESETLHDAMDFHVDGFGSYVRRRITPSEALQKELEIANVAFWPVVPEISQPAHRSGPLSAVFLGLTAPVIGKRIIAEPIRLKQCGPGPYKRLPHILNVLRDPLSTLGFVPRFLYKRRYAKHRIPGFFLPNRARRYGLEFHSEHLPDHASRMRLTEARDATGLRRMEIDFRFSRRDVESVLRVHTALERWLCDEGLARLDYRYSEEARAEGVLHEAKHGNHQEGTIRMGDDPKSAVVNGFGTSHDLANLHLVSTAILPTSSQANPTFTALQLGLRLADQLTE